VANALNVATKEANGEIIHYLHSDDYYLDNGSLKRTLAYFDEDPETVWVTGNFLVDIRERIIAIPKTHFFPVNPQKSANMYEHHFA